MFPRFMVLFLIFSLFVCTKQIKPPNTSPPQISTHLQGLTTQIPLSTTPSNDLLQKVLEVSKKTSRATYRLYYFKDTYIGSAWSPKTKDFRGTILVTAAHCVVDETSGKPRSNFWWIGHPTWDTEKRLQFTLLTYDIAKDVAILFSMENYGLEELEISNVPPQFTDPLFVVANTPESSASFIIGNYISRVIIPKRNQPCDLITNYTRGGCSGAPVITIEGDVMGMIRGLLRFESNGFIVGNTAPHDILIEVLRSAKITPIIKE